MAGPERIVSRRGGALFGPWNGWIMDVLDGVVSALSALYQRLSFFSTRHYLLSLDMTLSQTMNNEHVRSTRLLIFEVPFLSPVGTPRCRFWCPCVNLDN